MSAPNPSTALAVVIVDELVKQGLRRAVLAPGSRSAPLAYALAANSVIDVHVALDERSAGFFALGAGKVGELAAVVTTSGTATANLYPAIIEAEAGATPLVVITADRPPELRNVGANQTIDQVQLYGSRVRWFAELGPAQDLPGEVAGWRSIVGEAARTALGARGRPGPVHLNVAFREPLVPLSDDGRTVTRPYSSILDGEGLDGAGWSEGGQPPQGLVDLELKGRVLVVLGEGASQDVAASALDSGCVVVAEAHSSLRFPGTISTAHHLLASPRFLSGARPSTVVQMGRVGLSRHLAALLEAVGDRRVIGSHAWPGPGGVSVADGAAVRIVDAGIDRSWTSQWHRAEDTARVVLDDALDSEDVLDEPRTARDLAAVMPAGGTLVVGSSMPVRDLDWFMAPRLDLRVVGNRGASGIDGFVSTALGVASTSGRVVGLSGDLGLLHDQNGFLTRPRPHLIMVVVNNNGGGIFSFLPQATFLSHFEQLFGTPHGVDLEGLARLYQLEHRLLVTASDLRTEVEARMDAGAHLLEIRTTRAENLHRHRHLTELVVEALDQL